MSRLMQCLPCDRLTTHHPATLNYYHYKLFCIYLCNGMYAIANCWRGEKNPGGRQTFVLRGSVGDDLHDEGNWSANECVRTGTWYRKHDDGDQSKRQLIYTCKKNPTSTCVTGDYCFTQWFTVKSQSASRWHPVS